MSVSVFSRVAALFIKMAGLDLLFSSKTLDEARSRYLTGCYGSVQCSASTSLRGTSHFLVAHRASPLAAAFRSAASAASSLMFREMLMHGHCI